jgi:hypothetical protein
MNRRTAFLGQLLVVLVSTLSAQVSPCSEGNIYGCYEETNPMRRHDVALRHHDQQGLTISDHILPQDRVVWGGQVLNLRQDKNYGPMADLIPGNLALIVPSYLSGNAITFVLHVKDPLYVNREAVLWMMGTNNQTLAGLERHPDGWRLLRKTGFTPLQTLTRITFWDPAVPAAKDDASARWRTIFICFRKDGKTRIDQFSLDPAVPPRNDGKPSRPIYSWEAAMIDFGLPFESYPPPESGGSPTLRYLPIEQFTVGSPEERLASLTSFHKLLIFDGELSKEQKVAVFNVEFTAERPNQAPPLPLDTWPCNTGFFWTRTEKTVKTACGLLYSPFPNLAPDPVSDSAASNCPNCRRVESSPVSGGTANVVKK